MINNADALLALTIYSLIRAAVFIVTMDVLSRYERRKAVQELLITIILFLIVLGVNFRG